MRRLVNVTVLERMEEELLNGGLNVRMFYALSLITVINRMTMQRKSQEMRIIDRNSFDDH